MSTDKMNSSAVYALFEEIKQKITELENKATQNVQTNSVVNTSEISALIEEIRNFSNQKQFTKEQVKKLEEMMALFIGSALRQAFEKSNKDFSKITELINQVTENIESLSNAKSTKIRNEHVFSIDFKNSKATIVMIAMGLIIMFSLTGNILQSRRNNQLHDSDLKYRYVKMQGEANSETLLKLETIFTYNRNEDSISLIRKRVETFERLVKEQAEKFERALLNANEAEKLQREADEVKSSK